MHQIGTKRLQDSARMGTKGDQQEIVQEIKFYSTKIKDTCTEQNLFYKMRRRKITRILRFKWIT